MRKISKIFDLIASKQKPNPIDLIPSRFLRAFNEHDVETSQIPRLLPQLTLDDLKSPESLLPKLTSTLLDQVAKLWGIRVEWLEGTTDTIYPFWSCYKQPNLLFDLLKTIKRSDLIDAPMRIITSTPKFDYKDSCFQPFLLVIVETFNEIGENKLSRYYLDSQWDWANPTCRIQVKAMASIYYTNTNSPIPIYKVSHEDFEAIVALEQIPNKFMRGSLCTETSLEDFILNKEQSGQFKESEELPKVFDFIQEFKLVEGFTAIEDNSEPQKVETFSNSSSQQKEAAEARHQPTNQLKRDCVIYWLNLQKFSNREVARRFYDSLPLDKKRLLTDSNAVKTLSQAISEYRNKDKKTKPPKWLEGFDPQNTQ